MSYEFKHNHLLLITHVWETNKIPVFKAPPKAIAIGPGSKPSCPSLWGHWLSRERREAKPSWKLHHWLKGGGMKKFPRPCSISDGFFTFSFVPVFLAVDGV